MLVSGFPRFRFMFLGRRGFLDDWVGFIRTGHFCMNVVKIKMKCEKCVKMKNTMEKMKRLFRENDASEKDVVKSENGK